HRRDHPRMRVTDVRHADPGEEVEVAPALNVDHRATLGGGDLETERLGRRLRDVTAEAIREPVPSFVDGLVHSHSKSRRACGVLNRRIASSGNTMSQASPPASNRSLMATA